MSIKERLNITIESKIYLVFAFLGAILLFYSIWDVKPVVVGGNSFGLGSYLPLTYWIGYILMALCSIILYLDRKIKNDGIYLVFLILIGLFLFGVSVFTEENARYAWSYYPAGDINLVLGAGKIDKISEFPIDSYRSWPGSHIISLFMVTLGNISLDNLIKYMPIFWVFVLIFITYSIGKLLKLPADQCFMTSFLILSSFWTMNYYYGPQSIAYILYLLFFALTVSFIYRRSDIAGYVSTILVFITAVMTHMLTSIVLITSFISSRYIQSLSKNRVNFVALFTMIFIGWYIYVAYLMFNVGIKDLVAQITGSQLFHVLNSEKYSIGDNPIRQIIHYIRIIYLGIYAIFMMMAVMQYLKGKIGEKNDAIIKTCFLWFIGILALLPFRYGAEMDDRVYILSLLPMTLIIILTLDRKIVTILAILLVALHIPAHYGTESYDMVYTTELKGSQFAASILGSYDSINYYYIPLIEYYNPQRKPDIIPTGFYQGIYMPTNESLDSSKYIVHSKQIDNYLLYVFGIDEIQTFIKEDNGKFNLMYNNGFYSIYKNGLKR